MYQCPTCKIQLNRKKNPFGIFWACPYCSGKAISISILRQAIPETIVNNFWHNVKLQDYPQKKSCPACKKLMSEVPLAIDHRVLEYLDICTTCFFIWFDTNEFDALPKVKIPEHIISELPFEVRKAVAEYQIGRIATQREKEIELEKTKKEIAIEIMVAIIISAIIKA